MNHTILPNGNILLTAGNAERADLAAVFQDGGYYAAEQLVAESFHEILEFIQPENIGALTEAPILTDDADYPDDGNGPVPHDGANVWWYPNYMVRDPWEELKNRGRVEFTNAKSVL